MTVLLSRGMSRVTDSCSGAQLRRALLPRRSGTGPWR